MFEFKEVRYKEVIDIPALSIEQSEVTAFVGASGSGKSTVLKLLSKLISPTAGKILYEGKDLQLLDSVAYRRQVTLLSQNPALFGSNIRDNLTIGHRFQQRPFPDDEALQKILNDINISKPLEHPVSTLSGGEKQRIALGRLLLLDPEVYLLDEPSSALDESTEQDIIRLLTQHINASKKTLVMATHAKAIAEEYADAIVEFTGGRCKSKRRAV